MKLIYVKLSRDEKFAKKIEPILNSLKANDHQIVQASKTTSEYRLMITSPLYRALEMSIDRAGEAVHAKVYFVYTTALENELMTAVSEGRLSSSDYSTRLVERVRALPKSEYHSMMDSFASPQNDVFNEDWQALKRNIYFVHHAIEIEKDGS